MTVISKKICLLGDFGVGKTSLVRRFVYDFFEDKYISTIGVKVSRKTVTIVRQDDTIDLTFMLWDLAGSEVFSRIQATYLRGSSGAVLVCDLTRPETLESMSGYVQDLLSINPNAMFAIAGNKQDMRDQRQISDEQIAEMANRLDAPHYLTSAKTGQAVDTLFRQLGEHLISE